MDIYICYSLTIIIIIIIIHSMPHYYLYSYLSFSDYYHYHDYFASHAPLSTCTKNMTGSPGQADLH